MRVRWMLLSVCLLCVACGAAPTRPGALPAAAAPSPAAGPALKSLQMVDDLAGWAWSDGAVLRTADAGRHWLDVTPPGAVASANRYLQGVHFFDARSGFVLLSGNDPPVELFRTADSGQSWSKSQLADLPFAYLTAISFPDPSHGWLMLSRGAAMGKEGVDVYHSSDGGTTWTHVAGADPRYPSPDGSLPAGGDKTGLAFCDASNGWATGTAVVPIDRSPQVWLYATHDGGHSWQAQNLALPPSLVPGSAVATEPPLCFRAGEIILPVRLQRQAGTALRFYASRDGGQTWSAAHDLMVAPTASYAFADAHHGWVADGHIVRITADGGATWSTAPLPGGFERVLRVSAASLRSLWLLAYDRAADSNRLLGSTDGGHTWATLQP